MCVLGRFNVHNRICAKWEYVDELDEPLARASLMHEHEWTWTHNKKTYTYVKHVLQYIIYLFDVIIP